MVNSAEVCFDFSGFKKPIRQLSNTRTFHVLAGNQVQEIHGKTSPDQWYYIGTKENPANVASCSSSVQELIDDHLWWNRPHLLWKPFKDWNLTNVITEISLEDPELKRVSALVT